MKKELATTKSELINNESVFVPATSDHHGAVPTQYSDAAIRDNTNLAYEKDQQHFIRWGGLLPATPDMLVRYLTHYASQLNPNTLERHLAGIKHWHVERGFPDPTYDRLVRKTLKGIKNLHGKPVKEARALRLDQIVTVSTFLKKRQSIFDIRNRALLLVGYFGFFRRSELVNIDWEHLTFMKEGLEILVLNSKEDDERKGEICALPSSPNDPILCPVSALLEWCHEAAIDHGPVFRQISRHETIMENRLSPQSVNLIIKEVATACGVPEGSVYSGHSTRRGPATDASRLGATFADIKRQGRWRSNASVWGYFEAGRRFEDNAASVLLRKNITEGET